MKCDYCKESKPIEYPIWNGIKIMCDECQFDMEEERQHMKERYNWREEDED